MRVTRIRKAGQRCYSELGAGAERPLFKGKIECFVRGGDTFGGSGRDSVVLRARDVGWGECFQGDGRNSFVREPVVDLLFLAVRALS